MGKNVILRICLLAFAAQGFCGCEQSMSDKGRIKPLQRTLYYEDGSSARPLVDGTVERGGLRSDAPYFTGVEEGPGEIAFFPIPVTRKTLEDGRDKFDIFCSVCHGKTGDGQGTIVRRGYAKPPSYHAQKWRGMTSGHFFKVIARGFGDMPSYDDVLNEYERWAVAAYIKALQRSQSAGIEDAPVPVREKLNNLGAKETELSDEQ